MLYFQRRLGEGVRLAAVPSSILIALGVQRKGIEDVEVSVYSDTYASLADCWSYFR